jgi:signal transduction histidine kinase
VDPALRRRLHRLVAAALLLAVAAQAVVALALPGAGAVVPLSWLHGAVLAGLLLALCVVADVYAVRIRHGEEAEELTLADAAVVVCALLLPPVQALIVPVAASAVCSLVRRREPVKLLFNAAVMGIGSALVVGAVHVATGPGAGIGVATAVGLVVGMFASTAVNLVLVAHVLAVVGGDDPKQVVRDGMRLSAVMALGTTGLGATAVTLADAAPALLPFSVLPAAALTFAYRAAAQEAEERQRSSRLLALSEVLAGRLEAGEVLAAFLRLARQAFGADVASALLLDDGDARCATDDRVLGAAQRGATDDERHLLRLAGAGGAVLPPELLAGCVDRGWASALLAPLEADGRRLGVVVIASRDRHRRLGAADLSLLTPLAAALGVALAGAEHLRRLVEETSKLQAVVDRSSDGIAVLASDGVVQLWSPAAAELTGVPAATALGAPLTALVRASTPPTENDDRGDGRPADTPVDAFHAGRRRLSPTDPQAVVELVLHRADGEARVVRFAHAGVFDEHGGLERDVVLLHDVTRERQVERLKADFIATVSHELRTPVTPIKGYADLLLRRGDAMTPERRRECLEVIGDRAAHLGRLVEDLLLASRMSATSGQGAAHGAVALGHHDLGPLVKRACGDFGDDGRRLRLQLPSEPAFVACDPMRAVQVVGNLVGNALKYSAAGTPVDVRLLIDDGAARVEVQDRGRGIPADHVDKVFEKFHRVEDPMRMTTGGTGLGLYIARELTRAMGGELGCTSVLGAGSTFTLTLPRVAVPAADEADDGVVRPLGGPPLPRRCDGAPATSVRHAGEPGIRALG